MGLLDRVAQAMNPRNERSTIDTWLNDYLIPANSFNFNGVGYQFGASNELGAMAGLSQTYSLMKQTKELTASLPSYAAAVKACPPAFAAETVRAMVLSQVRFTFRRKRGGNPNNKGTYGTQALSLLENPWPGGTTGDLVSRMEWHAGLAGNAYVLRQKSIGGQPRLRVLRPDWVAVVYASELEPNDPVLALDSELIGYLYANGGFTKPGVQVTPILPEDMAHWYPMPDPESNSMGMSWITPAAREMQSDQAANEHKLMFFKNGATPNLVIKGLPGANKKAFDAAVDMLEARHAGTYNAYKTLYLTGGADATVVGSNFSDMAFNDVIAAGETRISALSRVPAVMLGLSEGLRGAALNAGNFGQIRRMFADTWIYPMLENLADSLSPLISVPSDSELWFDVIDMPILREDAIDSASIIQTQASTIGQLINNGFTPESAQAAILANDLSMLKPIPGWITVQLQNMAAASNGSSIGIDNNGNNEPGTNPSGVPASGKGAKNVQA